MATACPRVHFSLCERDDPEGPQSRQTTTNRAGHNIVCLNVCEIAKVSRIVASGGFQLRHALVTFGGVSTDATFPAARGTFIAS